MEGAIYFRGLVAEQVPRPKTQSDCAPELEERLVRLHEALGFARQRVALQGTALRGLKDGLQDAARRLARLEQDAPILLTPAPGAPRPASVGRLSRRSPPPPTPWLKALPYAVLAAAAVLLAHPSRPTVHKAVAVARPVLPTQAPPPREAVDPWDGEEARDAALAFVQEFRPRGAKGSVAEILAPELNQSSDGHPWVVQRTGKGLFFVAFRPYGEVLGYATPIYEFEVDLKSGEVTASPETLRSLGGTRT